MGLLSAGAAVVGKQLENAAAGGGVTGLASNALLAVAQYFGYKRERQALQNSPAMQTAAELNDIKLQAMKDAELVELARQGNKDAQKELERRTGRPPVI